MGTPLPGAAEKQEEAVYIPGAGSLNRLKNQDLRRFNKEGEGKFDTRLVSILSESDFILFFLFRCH